MELVLVVEDEYEIAELLEDYLRREGYRTERASSGRQALELFHAARPNLVLLDILLPELDGVEVLRRIRAHGSTPVILLTARAEEDDKITGLELGADDYVTKPFRPREVMARVKALLRRVRMDEEPPEAPLRVGPIEVDPVRATVRVNSAPLELTATEFRLLLQLARHPGRTFNRAELLDAVLPESNALERVIDVHLGHIRRKLETRAASGHLQTVRGLGYRLTEQL